MATGGEKNVNVSVRVRERERERALEYYPRGRVE